MYYWIGLDFSGGSDYANGSQVSRQSVACYSSPDLVHWTNMGDILTNSSTGVNLLDPNYVIARPKVVHHVQTGNDYWAMWLSYHNKAGEADGDYETVVAQSSSVCGQYSYVRAPFEPVASNTETAVPSGDIGLYQEGSNVYLISADSRPMDGDNPNPGMYIYSLTSDYEHVDSQISYLALSCTSTPPNPPPPPQLGCKEAPALFKANGVYYLLASETTGWRPNENWYNTTTSLTGTWSGWVPLVDPGTSSTTFISQTMEVIQLSNSSGTVYVYMGDRHNSADKTDSFYVWQPLQVNSNHTLTLPFDSSWNLDLSAETAHNDGTGYFNLTSRSSGEALQGTTLSQGNLNGNVSQEWQLIGDDCGSATGQDYTPYYQIVNNSANPQVALDAPSATLPTVQLDQYVCGTASQDWEIISVSGGPYVQLVNRQSQMVLTVNSSGGIDQENNSETTSTLPTNNQQWGVTEIPSFWAYTAEGNVDQQAGGPWFGSPSDDGDHVSNIVGMAATNDGGGYWLVASDGTVYSYGDAVQSPPVGNISLKPCSNPGNPAIVGVTAAPGGGFWAFTNCGSVYNEAGAPWFGSLYANPPTVDNIAGMAAGSDGSSYWLVGADGKVYAFSQGSGETTTSFSLKPCNNPGNPNIAGATGDLALAGGFWAFTDCGSVYNEGTAPWFGSHYANPPTVVNITGMAATPDGQGYWLAGSDGSIYDFGDATASGSFTPQNPVVGIVANPNL